ncbi:MULTISPECIES: hypothetical protein [unclassified Microbacterium]|uniref:hypothetical protein n=1 Tax=unclassified Microbacterium TaxID=2609290 RepID=UPI000CFDD72C|nr:MULTISPECIES: hypothetical protein [unclassified Microbacterium]PQZ53154.1 hypothetical protein CQ032_15730 [Microbacterium sp. MYb43]PQZ74696.1 hypothetical protein CQ031_15075 [Microbacterium sp. MYb40]PRB18784.1 hypothetical protein CQ040_16380 [Microbacterium sp. MYb54]PRB23644.1 hypothetical protein CQ037_17180 [Microbacterium sp. MYb50]PRB63347.1 hypothetical protein CQ021_16725 [Microbacterium sp. MYb24]
MSIRASRVVYIGRRLLTGQKIAYWYRELDDTNTLGAAKGAFLPYQAGIPIGAILEIRQPGDDPTKILLNGPNAPRVVDSWPHPTDIETWRLDDRADTQAAHTAQRAQNALQDIPDTFEQALDTLAAHFACLTAPQRAAMLPFVQARILSHTTREEPA